jgi:hypothetical protein
MLATLPRLAGVTRAQCLLFGARTVVETSEVDSRIRHQGVRSVLSELRGRHSWRDLDTSPTPSPALLRSAIPCRL